MRPRHAAVLTLLLMAGCTAQSVLSGAWLLLVPPITTNGKVDDTQPLSEWREAWSFRTQIDCTAFLQRQQFAVHGIFGPLTSGSAQSFDQIQALEILEGQCVGRNNPRLRQY
jgi:hypothetical protein